ncbi:MAG: lasso peptide biosynthesis PqqD family chaperone [Flammeovirgaceae bacterium]
MNLTGDTILERNEAKFLSSDLGDEVVMMNLENGNYIGLNEVGGDIWKFMESPIKISELINKLIETYDVNPQECEADVMSYLEKMLEKGLVIKQ